MTVCLSLPPQVRVTVTTGWVLGEGPCGAGCSLAKIGDSTMGQRRQLTKSDKYYFGKWTRRYPYPDADLLDITDHVNQNISGHIIDVDVPLQWVQEQATFYLDINATRGYTKVLLEGHSWKNANLQNCDQPCKYDLYQNIFPDLINKAPLVIFKPVYRVKLDEVTQIPIRALDDDGDAVVCRAARYIEMGDVRTMPNTSISHHCVVTISAFKQDNMEAGDSGIINLIIDEYQSYDKDISVSYVTMSPTPVQFLIEIVADTTRPEFTNPAACMKHNTKASIFQVYVGSNVNIPLSAVPSRNSPSFVNIRKFQLKLLPRDKNVSIPSVVSAQTSQRELQAHLKWRVGSGMIGKYLISVVAVDSNGYASEECNFEVDVQRANYTAGIRCLIDAVCTVPVFAHDDSQNVQQITHMTIANVSRALSRLDTSDIGYVIVDGARVYQTDVTLSSSTVGIVEICLNIDFSLGKQTAHCLTIDFYDYHPCITNYGICGTGGTCYQNETNLSEVYCVCDQEHRGQFCDQKFDPCSEDYCATNGTMQCFFDPPVIPSITCYCLPGWTGTRCETWAECLGGPCTNNGECLPGNAVSEYECSCQTGFSGRNCSVIETVTPTPKEARSSVIVQNISATTSTTLMSSTTKITTTSGVKHLRMTTNPSEVLIGQPVTLICEPGDLTGFSAVSFMQISKVKGDGSLQRLVEMISGSQRPAIIDSSYFFRSAQTSGCLTFDQGVRLTMTFPHAQESDTGKYRCSMSYVGHGVTGELKQGQLEASGDLHVWDAKSITDELTRLRHSCNCTSP